MILFLVEGKIFYLPLLLVNSDRLLMQWNYMHAKHVEKKLNDCFTNQFLSFFFLLLFRLSIFCVCGPVLVDSPRDHLVTWPHCMS